ASDNFSCLRRNVGRTVLPGERVERTHLWFVARSGYGEMAMARLAANRAPLSVRSRKVSANRRRFLGGVVSVLLVTGVLVVVASPASAGVPGAPGTPV